MIYDYIIRIPTTQAYNANIEAMLALIHEDGGMSPSSQSIEDANGDHVSYSRENQKGTSRTEYKAALKRGTNEAGYAVVRANAAAEDKKLQLLHFRLRQRFDEAELLTYLGSVLRAPRLPVLVVSIRSRDIINTGTKRAPVFEREEIVKVNKADILEFFEINTFDRDGNITATRKALMSDTISFSRYGGVPEMIV